MMSFVRTSCVLANPADRGRTWDLRVVEVNPASPLTWIERSVLRRIGVRAADPVRSLELPDGRSVIRRTGSVVLRVGRSETVDDVVFAEVGDPQHLGARTLSGLRLRVDPLTNLVVPIGPIGEIAPTV